MENLQATDKLLIDVLNIENLSGVELAKKLELPIGHYYFAAGFHQNVHPFCICLVHGKLINPPMADMCCEYGAIYCPECGKRVPFQSAEDAMNKVDPGCTRCGADCDCDTCDECKYEIEQEQIQEQRDFEAGVR